ncbi:RcnB family protein [Pseudomonas syringae]|uniref:RcnB family protein n=1 Tax=Pseudomonas quasicaspiana TaxID=2829821 RepID=UPI001E376F5D|nr:RcnB family protein [Pseudomonas quasicaspiana]MCD5991251.1 RcnB family protein [Pseudomonas quasicaspiana]MCQ3029884.1 RcnB family protein [Pseudomonas syringae]
MKSKSLVACLAILGCVSLTSLSVQAADAPEPTIEKSKENMHELELGSRAPEKFRRPEEGLKDWSKRGLKEPAKESQWVQINDKYVQVQLTNGQITEIVPVKKK